jgi:hypothetical protein
MSETPEQLAQRLDRLELAIRQLYALECRLKPANFKAMPMPQLQDIVEETGK